MTHAVSLAWAAGFLEGEGSFVASGSSMTVCAVQVQREPLTRLEALFGGTLRCYVNKRGTAVHRWTLHGAHAVALSFTLYTFMSPRRREQIRQMVAAWKLRPGRNNRLKTQCPRGHAYTPENTYRMGKSRSRGCRECYRTYYYNHSRLAKEA